MRPFRNYLSSTEQTELFKVNKQSAKEHIEKTCGKGWLTLVDIVYDNQPEDVTVTEVFQKWGGLKVDYHGENELFEELVESVYVISQKMCEVCGSSGRLSILDGWETTLCDEHFRASNAVQKYRE